MSTDQSLESRIKAEFATRAARVIKYRETQVREHEAREERLKRFSQQLDELREICRPKLESLAAQFQESVQVVPQYTPSSRQAEFSFESPLARIRLRFRIVPDNEVRNVITTYDLDILPIFVDFERHAVELTNDSNIREQEES